MATETATSFRIFYLDWPMALSPEKFTPQEMLDFYEGTMTFWLPRDFLPRTKSHHKTAALQVFSSLTPSMLQQGRWRNYQVGDMGDMNIATHSLRQAGVTALALYADTPYFRLPLEDRDRTVAAAIIHDLGEIVTTDITYDQKQGDKRTVELAESKAVMQMLDEQTYIGENWQRKLKEVYLKVTTTLDTDDISDLLGHKVPSRGSERWLKLRGLFSLYERYGYLITAIEQWPFKPTFQNNYEIPYPSPSDSEKIQKWNRPELEEAIAQGEAVSDHVKAAVLFKNVILNQWPHIQKARAAGIPSAQAFFNDPFSCWVIELADEMMKLNLNS